MQMANIGMFAEFIARSLTNKHNSSIYMVNILVIKYKVVLLHPK
jgi:hypothetical protein